MPFRRDVAGVCRGWSQVKRAKMLLSLRLMLWPLKTMIVVLAIAGATTVQAGIISVSSPVNLAYQGNVTFQPINFTGPDAILSVQFNSMSPITTTITYDSNGDIGFGIGPGLRITDIIQNNSGRPWSRFEVRFSGSQGELFAGDEFSPAIVAVTNPLGPNPVITATTPFNYGSNGGLIVYSADHKKDSFFLPVPIPVGGGHWKFMPPPTH